MGREKSVLSVLGQHGMPTNTGTDSNLFSCTLCRSLCIHRSYWLFSSCNSYSGRSIRAIALLVLHTVISCACLFFAHRKENLTVRHSAARPVLISAPSSSVSMVFVFFSLIDMDETLFRRCPCGVGSAGMIASFVIAILGGIGTFFLSSFL